MSDHRAPSASPGPGRGQDHEPHAVLRCQRSTGSVHGGEGVGHFEVVHRPVVSLSLRHRGKGAVYELARHIVLDVAVGHRPSQRRADARADAAAGFGLGRPDGLQDAQHVDLLDAVHGHGAEGGHGVALQGLHPGVDVPGVSPAGQIRLMHGLRCLPECRRRPSALLSEGVAAVSDSNAIVVGVVAGLGQRHEPDRTQPEVPAATVYGDSLHPALRSAGGDVQVQPVTVGVPARLGGGLDLRGAELSHVVPTSFPTLLVGI